MYRRLEQARAITDVHASETWRDTAVRGEMRATGRTAIAASGGAEFVRTASTGFNWHTKFRSSLVVATIAVVSIALVFAYTTLLTNEGVAASTLALLVVLLAATLASVAGFAFSAICGVMLLRIMSDPVQVVEIMILCSIAIQSVSVAMLWRDIDWRRLTVFLAGGAIGLPLGVWLLMHLGHVWVKETIGGLLIAYAAFRLLWRPGAVVSNNAPADFCVGVLGGITGGLAGFPGAAVTIWCGMKGWDKRRQRGVYQPFILLMQVMALVLIQFMRATAARGGGLGVEHLQFVPVALLGTWFGLAIFRRLSDRSFALTVNVLLLVSGAGLLV